MSKIAGHWVIALVVILVVAALAINQIDDHLPGHDAKYSLLRSGWLEAGSIGPAAVLERLQVRSPDQAPLYFLLLNQWGNLVGRADIALARLPAVFCGLLSLAFVYRLGRDAVSPLAGAFVVLLLASNAFFNYYYAHVRFYPQLVLLSTLVIWLYLRLAVMRGGASFARRVGSRMRRACQHPRLWLPDLPCLLALSSALCSQESTLAACRCGGGRWLGFGGTADNLDPNGGCGVRSQESRSPSRRSD